MKSVRARSFAESFRNIALAGLGIAALAGLSGCNDAKKAEGASGAIRIGIQPNEKDADLDAFKQDLGRRIGMPVELVVSPDYSELVKRFKAGELDFAFFSPLNFVEAERTAGAKVLLKKVYDKSEFYWSAIIVRKDSPVKQVAELKGKKFGFVDPKSASGYLYALHLLQAGGVGKGDVQGEFLGTHDAALGALLDKKVDAAAVWGDGPEAATGAWTLLQKTRADAGNVRVLVWSDPIPNDAFAVRAAFYEEQPMVSFKVMEALIGMSDDGDKVLKKVFNTERMATATSRHYDTVRALEKVLAQ